MNYAIWLVLIYCTVCQLYAFGALMLEIRSGKYAERMRSLEEREPIFQIMRPPLWCKVFACTVVILLAPINIWLPADEDTDDS